MNLDNVVAAVTQMFPSVNLNGAIQKAQDVISKTPNDINSISAAARNLGITQNAVNEIYNKYGKTMPGRAICGILGTTPEALKADADMIVSGSKQQSYTANTHQNSGCGFPRLK